VISGPFINFLLHNHFITDFFLKKNSGEAKDSVIFPFYFLLHKRAKPIHPPNQMAVLESYKSWTQSKKISIMLVFSTSPRRLTVSLLLNRRLLPRRLLPSLILIRV
jgi:hypothetical protein